MLGYTRLGYRSRARGGSLSLEPTMSSIDTPIFDPLAGGFRSRVIGILLQQDLAPGTFVASRFVRRWRDDDDDDDETYRYAYMLRSHRNELQIASTDPSRLPFFI
jgi:hypothetical protein|mmetsp:Transcript_19682/g.35728  ORF Transcript_19682/g.35728 Transcript_19682/m.35728 type:complete len:105 (-) Transcript_19682:355-669(-)